MSSTVKFELGELGFGGFIEIDGKRISDVTGVEVITNVGYPTLVKITVLAHVFGDVVTDLIQIKSNAEDVVEVGNKKYKVHE